MSGGLLSGLNSFAGGLASGINTATQIANRRAETKRQQEEHDANMKKIHDEDDLEAGISSAWQGAGRVSTAPMLEGHGYDTQEEANAAVAPRPQGLSQPKVQPEPPADQLAPLPDAPPQAMPTQQQAPPMVAVQDTMTGRWHTAAPDTVRDPTDADRARNVAAYLMSKGKVEKATKYLSDFANSQVSMRNMDKQAASDELARTVVNPTKFAQSLNGIFGQFGTGTEIKAVNVPDGQGGSYPALQINQQGSSAPPMWIGADGQPTAEKPLPGYYSQAAAALQGLAGGDKLGTVIANTLQFQATIQHMNVERNQEGRAQRREPHELNAIDAGIANTQANTARTTQATALDRNQDERASNQNQRENDSLYGTDGSHPVFGIPGAIPTDHPGSPRDGGKRTHKGWDYSGMKVGSGITMEKPGKVVAWKPNNGKAGNEIIVEYDDGTRHTIMHLDKYHKDFKPGSPFNAGQVVAFAGNTGNATTAGTDRAVIHVEGSAGQPGRAGIPGKAQEKVNEENSKRLATLTQDAIKAVTEEGQYQPGTGEFNAAVRTRVAGLAPLYGVGESSGAGREVPFKRK